MSTENLGAEATTSTTDDAALETGGALGDAARDPVQSHQETTKRSIREGLKAAFEESRKEPSPARQEAAARRAREQETGKFAPEPKDKPTPSQAKVETPAAAPEAKPNSEANTEAKSEPGKAPQAAPAAPASLSKEVRAIWDTLPDVVRNDIIKRESDTQKGVEQLQARYRPLDEAVAPYRPMLQQMGFTEGQAIKQLFDWHQALAGPNKVNAFRLLAQNHGLDLSTLVQAPAGQQQQPDNDPRLFVQQAILPISQELNALKQESMREQQRRVQNELAEFAKDKPHFDAVRHRMAELLEGARITGRQMTLQEAYDSAVWGSSEIREMLRAEERAKQEADAKAAQEAAQAKAAEAEAERKRKEKEAADKARKANVSPRGSTPLGSPVAKPRGGKSVRDTLTEVIKDARASM